MDILYFTTRTVPIPCANLSHHRVQKFAITIMTEETNEPCVPFDVFLFHQWERYEKFHHVCVIVGT